MVTVYGVRGHHAGFGMYQRDAEGQRFPEMDSVSDYTNYVLSETDLELVSEQDDEYERVEDADGKIYDQNGGEVIGWRERDGNVVLELVVEAGDTRG